MKRKSFGNRLTTVLMFACLVCAAAFMFSWYQLGRETVIDDTHDQSSDENAQSEFNRASFVAPDLATFSEILERPLFIEGRVPPAEPEPGQVLATVTTTKLRLQLEGVAITPEKRVAVVRDLSNNNLLRLAEGTEHQGWVVESVSSDGATFKKGEQSHELTLELDKSAPARTRRGISRK